MIAEWCDLPVQVLAHFISPLNNDFSDLFTGPIFESEKLVGRTKFSEFYLHLPASISPIKSSIKAQCFGLISIIYLFFVANTRCTLKRTSTTKRKEGMI